MRLTTLVTALVTVRVIKHRSINRNQSNNGNNISSNSNRNIHTTSKTQVTVVETAATEAICSKNSHLKSLWNTKRVLVRSIRRRQKTQEVCYGKAGAKQRA